MFKMQMFINDLCQIRCESESLPQLHYNGDPRELYSLSLKLTVEGYILTAMLTPNLFTFPVYNIYTL